jgi:fructokinase
MSQQILGIVSLGELLVDMVSPAVDASLAETTEFIKAPGGAPANVAVGAARLGVPAKFVGCVGNDPFGLWLKSIVENEGVDVSGMKLTDEARTTIAFVATRGDGKKDICFYRNPGADAMLRAEDLPAKLFDGTKVLHCGSVSLGLEPCRSAQFEAVRRAKEAGVLISFDPNWRPSLWSDFDLALELIWKMIPLSDLVKVADEEWEFVTRHADFETGAQKILAQGPKIVIMTMGAEGVRVATKEFEFFAPAFNVNAIDTIGAGDSFVAAFLAGICKFTTGEFAEFLTQERVESAITYANAAGALAAQKRGAIPSLPTPTEIETFLANQ